MITSTSTHGPASNSTAHRLRRARVKVRKHEAPDLSADRVTSIDQLRCAQAICEPPAYALWLSLGARRSIIRAAHARAYAAHKLISAHDIEHAHGYFQHQRQQPQQFALALH